MAKHVGDTTGVFGDYGPTSLKQLCLHFMPQGSANCITLAEQQPVGR